MGDLLPDEGPIDLNVALLRAHALGVSTLASLDDDSAARLPVADIYLALTAAAAITRIAAFNQHLAQISSIHQDAVRAALTLYQARWLYAQLRRLAVDVPSIADISAYLESVALGGPLRVDRRLVADVPERWLRLHRSGTSAQLASAGQAPRKSLLGAAWIYTAGQLPLLRYGSVDTVNFAVELQLTHLNATDRMEELRRDFAENSPVYWRSPSVARTDLVRSTFLKGEQLSHALSSKNVHMYITSVREDRKWVMECIAAVDPTLLTCALDELPLRFDLCCTARAAFDRTWLEQVAGMESVPTVDQCEEATDAYKSGVNAALRDRDSALLAATVRRHPNFQPLVALVTAAFEELKPLGIALNAAETLVSQTAQAALLDQTYSRAELGYPDPEILLGTVIDRVKAEQAADWPEPPRSR